MTALRGQAPIDAMVAELSAEGVALLHGLTPAQRSRALQMAVEMIRTALDAIHDAPEDAPDVVGYAMPESPPAALTALWERLLAEDEPTAEAAQHLVQAIGAVSLKQRA